MNLLKQYLKQRSKVIFCFILIYFIFFLSFLLYELPLRSLYYPFLLCIVINILFFIIDFYYVKKKHQTLSQIQVLYESFPMSQSIEEEAYQQIIHQLIQEQRDYKTQMDQKYDDMIDYYTTWGHQIKTPIAAMKLHLQNEDSPLSFKLSTDLFHIEQYVEMVMTYLRLDSNNTDYVFHEVDLDDVIRQVIKKFAPEFIERKIKLNYESISDFIISDEKWLSFVIEQVVSNALKYTPKGSISIYLKDKNILCVQDTGIGIASEDLPRVFEKGYTGYNGRMDSKASGLGLYLCKRVCDNLGHDISIDSIIDKGTTVYIDLSQVQLEKE